MSAELESIKTEIFWLAMTVIASAVVVCGWISSYAREFRRELAKLREEKP
jgi:hypothetical protein